MRSHALTSTAGDKPSGAQTRPETCAYRATGQPATGMRRNITDNFTQWNRTPTGGTLP